jgi:hypothetical protein
MSFTSFVAQPPGRILCVTASLALSASGIIALKGPGSYEIPLVSLVLIASIVGCVDAALFAVERFAGYTLGILVGMPGVGFLYAIGLQYADRAGGTVGAACLAAAAIPLALVVVAPSWSMRAAEGTRVRDERPAHAH